MGGFVSFDSSFFKLPFPPTHGAMCLRSLRVYPLQDAMKMESMIACTPHQWTIISREFTVGTTAIEGHPTNSTRFILGIPSPWSDSMPFCSIIPAGIQEEIGQRKLSPQSRTFVTKEWNRCLLPVDVSLQTLLWKWIKTLIMTRSMWANKQINPKFKHPFSTGYSRCMCARTCACFCSCAQACTPVCFWVCTKNAHALCMHLFE